MSLGMLCRVSCAVPWLNFCWCCEVLQEAFEEFSPDAKDQHEADEVEVIAVSCLGCANYPYS